jgi:peptide deformylase
VGLAAPQVGVNARLMVFNETGERGKGEEMVLANPEIVAWSKDTAPHEEGCLSFPDIFGDVEVSGSRWRALARPAGAQALRPGDRRPQAATERVLGAPARRPPQRPRAVKVRYQDAGGATKELELSGWPARIFQHEFDHLQARRRRGGEGGRGRGRLPTSTHARAACRAAGASSSRLRSPGSAPLPGLLAALHAPGTSTSRWAPPPHPRPARAPLPGQSAPPPPPCPGRRARCSTTA